ncbi:MAG: 3-oxoacyl-[acyl-carrier-protein] reductase [Desulfovibrio sp.]|nr:3-oxoacyl-[acyl-carrier-protein] reductase [Desulfovibrio sp.]
MSELPKTALVTGGSRGIGKAVALAMAATGRQVYLTYVSRPELAAEVVQTIAAAGGSAKAFALDVSDQSAVAAFFAEHIKDKVFLDVLVNNGGITKDGLILRMKPEDFERVLQVNLMGAFWCLQESAKIMTKQRAGSIVNIASVVGQTGNAGQANYVAAKAGLIGLTKTAAQELAPRNVTVNAVAPGYIETDMTHVLSEQAKEAFLTRVPLKRVGTPEDVAQAVTFLAGDQARYITGQVLAVNGGLFM